MVNRRISHATIVLAILTAATPLLAGSAHELDHGLRVEPLLENSWVVTDTEFFWSNVLVTRMPDGTVVIASSPFESVGTRTLLDWIHEELKPKQIVAINTHFHRDGTGGNHVFREAGVETWSSDRTVELLRADAEQLSEDTLQFYDTDEQRQRVRDTPLVAAEHTFKLADGKNFEFGEPVEVYFPGHAHAPDNLVVWLPERGLLFGGCMIKPGESLGYLRDADVAGWAAATRELRRFEATLVVPGHGRPGGPDLIERTVKLAERAASDP